MNAGAFCLGVLHLTKLIARRAGAHITLPDQSLSARRAITIALAAVSFLFLVYCLIAALNARSIYLQGEWRFEERPHIEWLPSSFDRNASLQAFWDFFALACVFWSVHGWLQGEVGAPASDSAGSRSRVPLRLQRLLWLLALNGALVAFSSALRERQNCFGSWRRAKTARPPPSLAPTLIVPTPPNFLIWFGPQRSDSGGICNSRSERAVTCSGVIF
jgi:hypothetical protein